MSHPVGAPRPARHLRVAGLALASVLAAACGSGGSSTAPATSAPSVPADAQAVSAREYEFAPAALSVPAGSVTFAIANAGTENHEFEVMQGETSLGKLEPFGPGTTKTLTVTLAAGEYTFVCRLNGHDILGMKGTLTVSGG